MNNTFLQPHLIDLNEQHIPTAAFMILNEQHIFTAALDRFLMNNTSLQPHLIDS
ncbi:MAG: hypothetical protein Gaeavirus1_13 [Gaeavirus sp.]|uniref:Uncharacterized protein n=1 Tax=Gaeavirus sp. TaxID=2487767 RepID=A0A3G4ZY79_9VIRU|nr:MAG: hypothetical protein Gaeavirus1_13 [Gaeavirus sp.]